MQDLKFKVNHVRCVSLIYKLDLSQKDTPCRIFLKDKQCKIYLVDAPYRIYFKNKPCKIYLINVDT